MEGKEGGTSLNGNPEEKSETESNNDDIKELPEGDRIGEEEEAGLWSAKWRVFQCTVLGKNSHISPIITLSLFCSSKIFSPVLGYLLVAICSGFFTASNAVVQLAENVDPFTIATVRFAIIFALSASVVIYMGHNPFPKGCLSCDKFDE